MDDCRIHVCDKPGVIRLTQLGDITVPCPKCGVNCEYKQMLFDKGKAFWEKLFDKETESFDHFLSFFVDPLEDGITVFYHQGKFECYLGGPVVCRTCPTPRGLNNIPGMCPYNLEAVVLWNQTIERQAVMLEGLRKHGIKIFCVPNEDIALGVDCTQPMTKQTRDLLKRCKFSKTSNDTMQWVHIKRGHLKKIHRMFVEAKKKNAS